MDGERTAKVIKLQRHPDGVAAGLRTSLRAGHHELVTVGADPSFALIGGDPFNTAVSTGLLVPPTPTRTFAAELRYLFLLAREQFNSGEAGVRLTGMRQYAELIARIPRESGPDRVFRKEISHPFFHPPDGNISWHVMVIPKTAMSRKSTTNTDSFIFRDSYGPALLYETPAPYAPPNGGRPWGKPIGASLGNIHDLRYRWRHEDFEYALDIPLPLPCDVALFASVRQNDPQTNPSVNELTPSQFAALDEEDQFLTAFSQFAQYGRIAGSLIFDANLGENKP